MTFESSRSKGRIATLLIVLLPIITASAYVPIYILGLSTGNVIYLSFILSALSYVGYILFLAAMHGLLKVYSDNRIFKNSLYGFTASIIGAVAFSIAVYTVLVPILDQLTAYAASPGTVPPLSVIASFLQVMLVVWLAGSALATITGFFYRRGVLCACRKIR